MDEGKKRKIGLFLVIWPFVVLGFLFLTVIYLKFGVWGILGGAALAAILVSICVGAGWADPKGTWVD